MSTFVLRGPDLPLSRLKVLREAFAGFSGALFAAVRIFANVVVEAETLRRDAERRYPYLTRD
ncbi:MAG TPA: hypothetical protein VFB45_12910 [Pseudolabrys sp.]|nr:hypothetical protein [Pseudolabrys sp.]